MSSSVQLIAHIPGADPGTSERMQRAVHRLLLELGEDPSREGLLDTPKRVTKAWMAMTALRPGDSEEAFGSAIFKVDEGPPAGGDPSAPSAAPGSLVVVRGAHFACLGEGSLLPLIGEAALAYVPRNGAVVGLSKLARITTAFSRKVQSLEGLAAALRDAIASHLDPSGVAVVLVAGDTARPFAPPSTAVAVAGCLAGARLAEVIASLRAAAARAHAPRPAPLGALRPVSGAAGVLADGAAGGGAAPAVSGTGGADGTPTPALVAAVATLLEETGSDPRGGGLAGAAERHARWLLDATSAGMGDGRSTCRDAAPRAGASKPARPAAPGADAAVPRLPRSESAAWTASPPLRPETPPLGRGTAPPLARATSGSPSGPGTPSPGGSAAGGGGDAGPSPTSSTASSFSDSDAPAVVYRQEFRPGHRAEPRGVRPALGAGRAGAASGRSPPPAPSRLSASLPFSSLCEHHLLPFHGHVRVVAERPAGGPAPSPAAFSALVARSLEHACRRLQLQERICATVADAIAAGLSEGPEALDAPVNVLVMAEASHMCMVARGARQHASSTVTIAARGGWETDDAARGTALAAALEDDLPQTKFAF